ncbi:hypothetical protein [Actinomyces procaprae]|uniref:hypothetical protein n=1 Tax=Actinomyces procaprae TaxID=2560010 RepID=UPI0010A20F3D|nr:hypothetical protein [Actinomyces procaprae]
MFTEYWHDDEYDAGNGYKWTDETMAADTENGVQKLDTPKLEGNTYLWVRGSGSENYVNGICFGNGFILAVALLDPEGSLDGPKTTQEAMDIMPELLTYIGTQAREHHAIPNYTSSKNPSTPRPIQRNRHHQHWHEPRRSVPVNRPEHRLAYGSSVGRTIIVWISATGIVVVVLVVWVLRLPAAPSVAE